MKSVPRVRVAPARSNLAIAGVLVATTASATLVAALALPWWLRALVISACAAQCALALRELAWTRPQVLAVAADRRVVVTRHDGSVREGTIAEWSYVSAAATSLVWRADGGRFCSVCLVAPDSLAADERRQLRVILRWSRARQPKEDVDVLAAPAPHCAPRSANAAPGPPANQVAASTHTPLSLFG